MVIRARLLTINNVIQRVDHVVRILGKVGAVYTSTPSEGTDRFTIITTRRVLYRLGDGINQYGRLSAPKYPLESNMATRNKEQGEGF